MLPEAPVLFSTRNDLPVVCESPDATRRVTTSTAEAAAKGLTISAGRDGQSCWAAANEAFRQSNTSSIDLIRTILAVRIFSLHPLLRDSHERSREKTESPVRVAGPAAPRPAAVRGRADGARRRTPVLPGQARDARARSVPPR